MIDPRLRARVERKLDLNERLVWAGKPVPWAFSKKTLGAMLFGIPWSFITAIVMSGFIYSFFFTEDGRGEPLALKIGICIFFVPFVTIGVGMLGAPLWARLRTPHWVYAVTDKRALIIGLFHTRDWRASELEFIDRADHRNGRSDLFFARGQATANGGLNNGSVHLVSRLIGFRNLPATEAPAAESALRALLRNRDRRNNA